MSASICSNCTQQFESDEAYIAHQCSATGFTPAQPEHLGPEFVAIQKAALERAKERDDVDNEKQDQAIAQLPAVEETASAEVAPTAPVYETS